MLKKFIFLALFIMLLMPSAGFAEETFIIGMPCYSKEFKLKELENILTEAYRRVGIKICFNYLPPKRMHNAAHFEDIDACALMCALQAELDDDFEIMSTPLVTSTIVAFSMPEVPLISSWEEMAGTKIAIARGSAILTCCTLDTMDIEIDLYNDLKYALTMLEEGRIDYILGDATATTIHAKALGFEIHASQPLKTTQLYHAVTQKNDRYIPALSRALREMLEDGTTMKLSGQYKALVPKL